MTIQCSVWGVSHSPWRMYSAVRLYVANNHPLASSVPQSFHGLLVLFINIETTKVHARGPRAFHGLYPRRCNDSHSEGWRASELGSVQPLISPRYSWLHNAKECPVSWPDTTHAACRTHDHTYSGHGEQSMSQAAKSMPPLFC